MFSSFDDAIFSLPIHHLIVGVYSFLSVFFFNDFFFLNKFIYFIYLFLAALGLCCCVWASSSCGERGLLFVAVCRLLIVVASLVAEHRL